MKLAHKILQSIYAPVGLGKNVSEEELILESLESKFEDLVKITKLKPEKIYSTLKLLQLKKDITFNEDKGIVTITDQGIKNLLEKSYLREYQNQVKEQFLFFRKIIGVAATIIGIILGISTMLGFCSNKNSNESSKKIETTEPLKNGK
jgi:hypothetical protein